VQVSAAEQHCTSNSATLSDDGKAVAASVRDAAMKALQSSESVRRRLVSTTEDPNANTFTNNSRRNCSAGTSERHNGLNNGTASEHSSTNNQQWVPGVLRFVSDGDLTLEVGATASVLDSMPSEVPRRPTLIPERGWNEPRAATAPVFGDDHAPTEHFGTRGSTAPSLHRNGSSGGMPRGGVKNPQVGGMDRNVAPCFDGSSHEPASSGCDGGVKSHALGSLDVPCESLSDRSVQVATGDASAMDASAPAGGPTASTRSAVRRSVSIAERWLSPGDTRKSADSRAGALIMLINMLSEVTIVSCTSC
jgi:hypothetical protein